MSLSLAALAVLAGCTAQAQPVPPPPPPARLSSSIPAGAAAVVPGTPLAITALDGTLSGVTVTPDGGPPLPGTLNPDGTVWTASAALAYGTTYQVAATAVNRDRSASTPLNSTFHTVDPAGLVRMQGSRPMDGQTVGIAMPISLYFSRNVTDRAAVERRLTVRTSVPTEGSFHWIDGNQVNWRPKDYWQPGTTVTVHAALFGVDTGGGVFGEADKDISFTVGRDQRAVGDVARHTFAVFADGRQLRVFPASFGRPQYPSENGIHVAFEKWPEKRMTSDSWGGPKKGEPGWYDEVLPNAVRISDNGEFVHINAATTWAQGRVNVSHGCVNLSPDNGAWYYGFVQLGDPVEIVNSPVPLTAREGDITDWTILWDQYVLGSALHG